MKNYTIRLYKSEDFGLWNAFISSAKNATFLFHRNFMEYHSNRFQDYSLMVFEGTELVSILPANKVDDILFSHQGLTYGGFVFNEKVKLGEVISILKSVLEFLQERKISSLQLKLIPSIYCNFFSEEIEYPLFLGDAKLIRRDCLSVIDLTRPIALSKDRRMGVQRGEKFNLKIKEEFSFGLFWNEILIPNLEKKHNTKPVHTLEEIMKLHLNFPKNIRQFNVYYEGRIVAGTTIFVTDRVAHSQYISGNEEKNQLGSLDFLHNYLICNVFKDKFYFDFGISHEHNGRKINEGLLYWKESFGARTTVQDYYEIATINHSLFDNVML